MTDIRGFYTINCLCRNNYKTKDTHQSLLRAQCKINGLHLILCDRIISLDAIYKAVNIYIYWWMSTKFLIRGSSPKKKKATVFIPL